MTLRPQVYSVQSCLYFESFSTDSERGAEVKGLTAAPPIVWTPTIAFCLDRKVSTERFRNILTYWVSFAMPGGSCWALIGWRLLSFWGLGWACSPAPGGSRCRPPLRLELPLIKATETFLSWSKIQIRYGFRKRSYIQPRKHAALCFPLRALSTSQPQPKTHTPREAVTMVTAGNRTTLSLATHHPASPPPIPLVCSRFIRLYRCFLPPTSCLGRVSEAFYPPPLRSVSSDSVCLTEARSVPDTQQSARWCVWTLCVFRERSVITGASGCCCRGLITVIKGQVMEPESASPGVTVETHGDTHLQPERPSL